LAIPAVATGVRAMLAAATEPRGGVRVAIDVDWQSVL
jgi:hypothetical protein